MDSTQILFCDFDGTLFSKDKRIATKDITILRQLNDQGVIRVIATGRSYYSIRKVIPEEFPVDYIILSSGAGIMDWRTKKLLKAGTIKGRLADQIIGRLLKNDIPFFVQDPLPNNHYGYFFLNQNHNPDFVRRLNLYPEELMPIEKRKPQSAASQFVLVHQNPAFIESLLNDWQSEIHFIKATSPIDHKTIWLEIFPAGVSKAKAAAYLSQYLHIPQSTTLAIGNDFNDLDLLEWAAKSFVMPDSPKVLLDRFQVLMPKDGSILSVLFWSTFNKK